MAQTCATTGCGKPASMQCPTCVKNGLPPTYFCGQECFKSFWPEHKAAHKAAKAAAAKAASDAAALFDKLASAGKGGGGPDGTFVKFPGFHFTGSLRPWPMTPQRTMPDSIPWPDYAVDGTPTSEVKARGSTTVKVLSPKEIAGMRKVCRLAREVLDIGARMMKPGTTCEEIDRAVHEACLERNSYPSPLNYYHFPKSCCTSVNEVICHGIPDTRPLQDGDICNLDITLYHEGFHGDLNETYFVGEVSQETKDLVRVSKECLEKAIDMCKPGTRYRDLGNTIQKHATAHGLSVVRSYCGHGIHSLFHTTPNVPHYAKNKAVGIMQPGHCFTIEPMINAGNWEDDTWPDSWTSVTRDGKRSAQFEETLLVTETGVERLTARLPDSPFSV